jgi:enoyl-CoA hydratase
MLDPDAFEAILIERLDDGVVLATLNRPERLNAVNPAMHRELAELPTAFDDDLEARVLVLTGAGRAFSSGGDASHPITELASHLFSPIEEPRRIVDRVLECRKPIISAINGYAMGLGATVALLADVVYAGRSAVIADTHVLMGVGAGDGGQVMWPFLIGVNRAKYYLMTGDRLTATEAERIGVVNFVVDDDQLLDTAVATATRMARSNIEAVIASKVPINAWLRAQAAQILPLSLAMEKITMDMHRKARPAPEGEQR